MLYVLNWGTLICAKKLVPVSQILILNTQLEIIRSCEIMLLRKIEQVFAELHIRHENFFDDSDAGDHSVLGHDLLILRQIKPRLHQPVLDPCSILQRRKMGVGYLTCLCFVQTQPLLSLLQLRRHIVITAHGRIQPFSLYLWLPETHGRLRVVHVFLHADFVLFHGFLVLPLLLSQVRVHRYVASLRTLGLLVELGEGELVFGEEILRYPDLILFILRVPFERFYV